MCTHNLCLKQKGGKIKYFQLNIVIFKAIEIRGIMHGCVVVIKR